ncbi:MAG: hypothetical protein ACRC1K_14565 [Planctomycetia bacterium]
MTPIPDNHPLHRLFAGFAEHAFFADMGYTDTKVVDYIAKLLARFIHRDDLFCMRDGEGRRVAELAAMLLEAERLSHRGDERRKLFQHIGDFALFWTGVYPEALHPRRGATKIDALVDYTTQGKRSYLVASMYTESPDQAAEAPVLRRLSDEFELCAAGLRKARTYWEATGRGQA